MAEVAFFCLNFLSVSLFLFFLIQNRFKLDVSNVI